VLIMTSNMPGDPSDYFRPEFINRIDDIIRFRSLTEDDLRRIVEIQLARLRERLAERRITLDVDTEAMALLARIGFDPAYGARPLKRVIQREIGDRAAVLILEGRAHEGSTIAVTTTHDPNGVESDGLRLDVVSSPATPGSGL
jgi:ATP-dependent Clp protease ATP-binding subunit ClpB